MIQIQNLRVSVEGKEILRNIDISFETGKTYYLLGQNGSGKSSLALTLMGHPKYYVEEGIITIDGENLATMTPDERSHKGLFLSLQNIPEVRGVRLGEYLRTIHNKHLSVGNKPLSPFLCRRYLTTLTKELSIPDSFLDRDLNVGFSGGEKRKIEILQMKLLNPKYIILDEIESGLDIDAFRTVAELLARVKNPENTLIIITHNFRMTEFVKPDEVIILKTGEIVERGGAELVEKIGMEGFGE
ncbi:Fe-S cluster assembly ATPase SufC [Candidatus Gracilibacteria bacterium]|nr:Fe-S cluster assembly ATPase SufC [bacterium]NDK19865.1 Fe-S cluster assembly ATPase SufC [Candidatus Gracilibacteria bacterium]OIO76237.1 MAG: Fe-S cluster assembly ATPase SufC [Candidatus Gracilibacteria bacterium CG1_02_38_174]PIQ11563.1 MAG: Fe-S cluster assembly ATPase SufC [Candidatus Gracilibacteria bacterium CG18_big_fil_WC_8_21_14_2_50_38_16]PIQ42301.1 MAG: Fe-S cluster assembly ATPase SufC [Candidatus Gracilibacteria bacterium CG12_big_fil_rev_8_21_14_0_65_38_15]PIZ02083.1 MAG: Fe